MSFYSEIISRNIEIICQIGLSCVSYGFSERTYFRKCLKYNVLALTVIILMKYRCWTWDICHHHHHWGRVPAPAQATVITGCGFTDKLGQRDFMLDKFYHLSPS